MGQVDCCALSRDNRLQLVFSSGCNVAWGERKRFSQNGAFELKFGTARQHRELSLRDTGSGSHRLMTRLGLVKERVDARNYFTHREWLDDEVGYSQLLADAEVVVRCFGSHDHHWSGTGLRFFSKPAADFNSTHARQQQIEKNQRRWIVLIERGGKSFFSGKSDTRFKILALKTITEHFRDVWIILDD